ncbi:RDD family protein [Sphingomonas sp. LB-2]|uniref:RDD family protein n=1 Tax=Sphingomonas caeni TaxID=2984949 RepID=UPI00222F9BCB|nr:RDD family protein [Sphingomonas caeni]MCW3848201.1 RDD family protein [Sphingomonas caeni]
MTFDRLEREFVTSEGIDLRLRLGRVGERAVALIIDCAIIYGVLLIFTLLAQFAFLSSKGAGQEATYVIWLIGSFLLRIGYFTAFELGMRGATPGKRLTKLRVVARDGGRLTGEAVVARNALRELEFFVPLTIFFSLLSSVGESDGGALLTVLAAFVTVAIFALFPLFNRDNLRVGDLLAGTWVVRQPRRQLGHTVGQRRQGAADFVFTEAQLDAYGEYELQRLEEVLRREDYESLLVVSRAIRRRIGWTGGGDELEFLQAYYTALCLRLERNMLFGKRRADKHSKA